jgi:hypothetical protein
MLHTTSNLYKVTSKSLGLDETMQQLYMSPQYKTEKTEGRKSIAWISTLRMS